MAYTGDKLYANRELFYTDGAQESTGSIEANNIGDANYVPGIISDPSCTGAPVYYVHTLYEVIGGTAGGTVVNNTVTVYSTAPSTGDLDQGRYVYNDDAGAFPFDGGNYYHYGNVLTYDEVGGDYMKINGEGKITDITS